MGKEEMKFVGNIFLGNAGATNMALSREWRTVLATVRGVPSLVWAWTEPENKSNNNDSQPNPARGRDKDRKWNKSLRFFK
jgi:hypothetical protein